MRNRPVSIVLVEDQTLVLNAMKALLEMDGGLCVTGAFDNPEKACSAITAEPPDVVLSDIEMPQMNGLQLAERLKRLCVPSRIILLSAFAKPGYVRRAMAAGVRGYLLKDTPPDRLLATIHDVMAGLRRFEATLIPDASGDETQLNERELVILGLVREGLTNAKIAQSLNLSHGTVRNALSVIIQTLGVNNRIEALRTAEKAGWL